MTRGVNFGSFHAIIDRSRQHLERKQGRGGETVTVFMLQSGPQPGVYNKEVQPPNLHLLLHLHLHRFIL